jgi:hypothetical protein
MRQFFAALLLAAACGSPVYADLNHPAIAIDVAPTKVRAPYDVQIIREDGQVLPTYALKDRFYVQGASGERYTIRVSNPTAHRVEAVVSVDGLDAVDGQPGDLRKRGYIVPAYGSVGIDGFRTSLDDVATFRFSSVGDSYAGLKGKARNVGVIAVAIFEENAPPPEQEPMIVGGNYDYREDLSDDSSADGTAQAEAPRKAKKAPAHRVATKDDAAPPPPPAATAAAPTTSGAGASRSAPADKRAYDEDDERDTGADRPGLGTEFGESRYSSATYTQFTRATDRPIAVAELRYNDAAGLVALGIPLQPMPDEYELMTRETANPFPGDRFAQPPR